MEDKWISLACGGFIKLAAIEAFRIEMKNHNRWVIMAHTSSEVYELYGEKETHDATSKDLADMMERFVFSG